MLLLIFYHILHGGFSVYTVAQVESNICVAVGLAVTVVIYHFKGAN